MAKFVAQLDFYSPLWESEEMHHVFEFGKDDEKKEYLLKNGRLQEPEMVEPDEIHDQEIGKGENYIIYYDDWGMLESIKLIMF